MTKLLHISASPRAENSKSQALALEYIKALADKAPETDVETLNLWQTDLPDFDGDFAAAKMTFFGEGDMTEEKQAAWNKVTDLTKRFTDADHYVINVPMWNGGIPYRLKQYIDIITQPGLLFGFDPEAGYSGLLQDKKATVIYTSGVWAPGADKRYGTDFHSTYLEWWLEFIGVSDIKSTRFQPSLLTESPQSGFDQALEELQSGI